MPAERAERKAAKAAVTSTSKSVKTAAVKSAPAKSPPPKSPPPKSAPAKAAPVKAAPVRPAPVKAAPVRSAPLKAAPVQGNPRATRTSGSGSNSRTAGSTRGATATRTSAGTRAPTVRTRRPEPRRVGIMGGTFDPIHHGHLVAASEVASRFLLDEVVFVPTGEPWQKGPATVSPAEDRYLMTVIATASNPSFHVSRVDIDRGGPTFTVDTLRDLKSQYGPKVQLFFITGADVLDKILSWKEPDQLFDLAHFVGVTRPGFLLSDDHLPRDTVSLIQVPAMAISSTDCRARVAAGLPVWYLVPDGVVQYINKRHLYR